MVTLLHVPNKILGEIGETWGKGQKMASGNVNSLSTWPPKLRVASAVPSFCLNTGGAWSRDGWAGKLVVWWLLSPALDRDTDLGCPLLSPHTSCPLHKHPSYKTESPQPHCAPCHCSGC